VAASEAVELGCGLALGTAVVGAQAFTSVNATTSTTRFTV
jgi:hypothetical protein